jgi:hypothetical protein
VASAAAPKTRVIPSAKVDKIHVRGCIEFLPVINR